MSSLNRNTISIKYLTSIRRIKYSSKDIASKVVEGLTYYTYNKKGYTSYIYH